MCCNFNPCGLQWLKKRNCYIQFIFDGVTGDAWFSDIKLELLNYNK